MGVPQSHFELPIMQYLQEQPVRQETFDDQLKIMTWNLLAERLVSRSHFPYVNPAHLSYRYRIDLTKRLIERMDCSLLALQQVDPTQCFFNFLNNLGYDYCYRSKGCFQGILIAYKKSQFELIQQKVIDYDSYISPKVRRFPYATGHGALLLKLLFRGKYKVVVGNTHLHWVPRHYKVKYHQTCTALAELNEFSEGDPSTLRFLMGDFNSLPDCNAVKLITHNQSPTMKPQYDDSTLRDMTSKFDENKHRIFRMKSAFNEQYMPYTNRTNTFKGAIDHMFYEQSPKLSVKSVYSCAASDIPLPNQVFPSDHVPLICTFGLNNC